VITMARLRSMTLGSERTADGAERPVYGLVFDDLTDDQMDGMSTVHQSGDLRAETGAVFVMSLPFPVDLPHDDPEPAPEPEPEPVSLSEAVDRAFRRRTYLGGGV
jgi:hypothetical protein